MYSSVSHSLARPSTQPVMSLPSVGAERQGQERPPRAGATGRASFPAAVSQNHTRPSSPAAASRLPSGWNATARTLASWPAGPVMGCPVAASQRQGIPDRLAVAIFDPSGLNRTAVTGASCRMGRPTGCPGHGIPPQQHAVVARRGGEPPVGADGDRPHGFLVDDRR